MSFLSKQELPPEENWLLHGDLTVSNMLVSNDKIKLIDPNPLQPFVHPTVDFGKLLQSFKCGYEFDFMNVRLIGKNMNMKILNTRSVAYAEMEDFLYSWIERNYHENYGYHARIQLLLHLFRIIPYAKNSEQVCWIVFHARIVFTELKSVWNQRFSLPYKSKDYKNDSIWLLEYLDSHKYLASYYVFPI